MSRSVRIALLGCGVVGSGFVALVERERERICARYGVELRIEHILVRDPERKRPVVIDRRLLTTSAVNAIDDDCDLIVELIGGVHAAGSYVRRAIGRGIDVITANKALLSACGRDLFAAAGRQGVTVGFEASVCGALPVVRVLQRGLAGDSVESLTGILNGTCNYVLTRMEEGLSFADALTLAQQHGFAEADPALDVDGEDAAQKLRILAELAFDDPVRRVTTTGIRCVTPAAVADAGRAGCVIRHVAEARRVAGGVELSVGPRLVPRTEPLARIVDEQNAVMIRGRASGELWFAGKGAGSLPTAAAVLADVVEIATQRVEDRRSRLSIAATA